MKGTRDQRATTWRRKMGGTGILLQSQHYGWVLSCMGWRSPFPPVGGGRALESSLFLSSWAPRGSLLCEALGVSAGALFLCLLFCRRSYLDNVASFSALKGCAAAAVHLHLNLRCCVFCRCQYSGPWTSWLKLVHEEYLPMLTRITSIPSPLIVTMKRTYLQMTCGLICGT